MGHLFCELFYRAKASGLTKNDRFEAPITLVQLGEALGMSIATVNRTLQDLRLSQTVEFLKGQLHVKNWDGLVKLAQFDPGYLHQKRPPF